MRTFCTLLTLLAVAVGPTWAQDKAPDEAPANTVATVNGTPIPMARLHEILVQDYGLPLARQLIADEVVRQEMVRRNLPIEVSPADLQLETLRSLNQIFQFTKKVPPEELESLLTQFLARQGLTRRQWDVTMTRNIRLERIASQEIEVTQEDLQAALEAMLDVKRIARHIQVPTLQQAQDLVKKARVGADFAELAKTYSTNPTGKAGGVLPEVGSKTAPTGFAPAILQVIRSMKVDEISSPVQIGTVFHIIKLEKIVPPPNMSLNDKHVRANLTAIVRAQKIAQARKRILQELIAKAKINIANPVVRAQDIEAKKAAQEPKE